MGNLHQRAFQNKTFRPEWKKVLYYLLKVGLLTIVYHVTAHLGIFLLEGGQRGVVLLSLQAGIALTALLVFGTSLWPGILIGVFIYKAPMATPLLLTAFESVGKVLEVLIGVWLLRHFQFQSTLTRVHDVLLFLIIIMIISPLLGASISSVGLWLYFSHAIAPQQISEIWLTAWLNDAIGMLVVASTLLVWRKLPAFFYANLRLLEWSLLLICLTVISALTLKVEQGDRLILLYVILPFAIWAAIRFEQHGATISVLLVSAILINGGLSRILPSAGTVNNAYLIFPATFRTDNMHNLLLEMGFIAITSSTALLVAAAYSERRQIESHLLKEKEQLLTTFHSIANAVITTNAAGLVTYLNPVAEGLTGWSNQQAKNKAITDIFRVKREPYNTLENSLEHGLHGVVSPYQRGILIDHDHQEKVIESSTAPIRNRQGHIEGMIIVFHDASQVHKHNFHHSSYDILTGLYNRQEFEYQLKTLLHQIRIVPAHHTLLHLNLDHFKRVIDRCGNGVGDLLLKQWVVLLQERVRQGDIFARLGDDDFAIILKNCPIHHAHAVAVDFINATQKFDFVCDEQIIKIELSIGAVPINTQSKNFMQILNLAELSCCAAKEHGGNQVYVHDESIK